jgi:transposase-like protein
MLPAIIKKNGKPYTERQNYEDAVWELECIARSWRANNGIVMKQIQDYLKVCEESGENETIFEIIIQ